uniref:Secreted protein n=1 Tax=Ciona intestinalis TaxID=7719 RepID=H2XLN2_CIOIN
MFVITICTFLLYRCQLNVHVASLLIVVRGHVLFDIRLGFQGNKPQGCFQSQNGRRMLCYILQVSDDDQRTDNEEITKCLVTIPHFLLFY